MRLPTFFISHGGGPWPYMKDELNGMYDVLEASLADMPRQIGGKPKAILMVSGHWENPEFTVMSNPQPPMVYDYGGFPAHTYQVKYGAPGSPALAARVQTLLQAADIHSRADENRGFDHGAFAPLAVMFPAADVPVVQLSLRRDYDVEAHLAAGRALAPLRDEGVLIVGSGLSYHNLSRFNASAAQPSQAFDQWLTAALVGSSPAERISRMAQWKQAPSAREAHPREDHLAPLWVALGAAEADAGERVYHEDAFFGAIAVSSYRFG